MSKNKLFNEALNDFKEIRNNLKKKIEGDLIKENEEKINNMVSKMMDSDNDSEETQEEPESTEVKTPEGDEVIDTETEPEGEESEEEETAEEINNIDLIDQILDSIKIEDGLENSEVEINVSNPETAEEPEGEETPEEDELTIDAELEEYHNLKQNNNTSTNMENKENMHSDTHPEQSSEEIQKTLKEIADELGEEKPDAETDEAPDAGDWSGLDEELAKEIQAMDEAEIKDILKEISEEMEEEGSDDDGKEENEEDELEEGMSVTSQTHKEVGGRNFPEREGKPERRSNMSEGISKEEFEKFKGEVNKLIQENTELKNINNKFAKKIDEMKSKLYEATVISHKTASVNQLFLECSLNQKDKQTILKEFVQVDTIDQSKEAYNKLKDQFSSKNVLRESIEEKIEKTTVQGDSTKLHETKLMGESSKSQYLKDMNELWKYKGKK